VARVLAADPGSLACSLGELLSEPKPGVTTVQVPVLSDAPPENKAAVGPGATSWGAQRVSGVAVGGAGVIGIVIGSIFGVQALSKKNASNASGHCDASDACDPTGIRLRSDSIRAGNISTATFVIGGVALAGGIVLFVTAPSSAATVTRGTSAQAGLMVGPGSVYLTGRW